MESILNSVKKILGIDTNYEYFDSELIMHINSVFFVLYQLGVGSDTGKPFVISDSSAVWTDFIDEGSAESIRSYVAARVRLLFDPPQQGTVMEMLKQQISEFEWRLNVEFDNKS